MHLKATEPYNDEAVATADKEIYRQHEGDKRPNPLYDKDGNRKPLDLCDTSHGDLREEWMRIYKREGGNVIEEKGRICPTCPPIAPCMVEKSITGRFAVTEVKCGDPVGLEADATNIPDGTQTTFTLRKLPEKSAFAKEYDPLSSSKVRGLEWISKKPSNDWPRPEVDFEVTADSETGDSENQLNFHRYPNLPPETETINCKSKNIITEKKKILSRTIEKKRIVNFAWTGKFDIEFKDGVMVITVKIKLINHPGPKPPKGKDPTDPPGPPVNNAYKQAMRMDIESKLTEKWLLHREKCKRGDGCNCPKDRKCCKFKIQIRVQFVESGEHHEVNLFNGSGRANAYNWTRTKKWPHSWAHETGHLLGWYDEYAKGAVGLPPRWKHVRAGAIMKDGLKVPKEYYWHFRDWYLGKSGESWKLINP